MKPYLMHLKAHNFMKWGCTLSVIILLQLQDSGKYWVYSANTHGCMGKKTKNYYIPDANLTSYISCNFHEKCTPNFDKFFVLCICWDTSWIDWVRILVFDNYQKDTLPLTISNVRATHMLSRNLSVWVHRSDMEIGFSISWTPL